MRIVVVAFLAPAPFVAQKARCEALAIHLEAFTLLAFASCNPIHVLLNLGI